MDKPRTDREQMLALLKKAQEMQARWAVEYTNVNCDIRMYKTENGISDRLWFTATAWHEGKEENAAVTACLYAWADHMANMIELNEFCEKVQEFGEERV